MKKAIKYLSGMKSGYFMLLACLILLVGVTSCSSDEFETNLPEELQTRANEPYPVVMTTAAQKVTIKCRATEDVVVYWGDGEHDLIPANSNEPFPHTFKATGKEYVISMYATKFAIEELDVSYNGLTRLNIKNNINLHTLSCDFNSLKELDFTGCQNLTNISATYNELSAIDVIHLSYLEKLNFSWNQLMEIDISQNTNLHTLELGMNRLTELDVSNNQNLKILNLEYNSIKNLDLTRNTALRKLFLEALPLEKINKSFINSKSFVSFPYLEELNISFTSFKALNLSSNPMLYGIGISGTEITELDISALQIAYLHALASNLTNFIYTENSLLYLVDLQISATPFERIDSNLWDLVTDALPDRSEQLDMNGQITEGVLYTTSSYIDTLRSYLALKNWVVYLQN